MTFLVTINAFMKIENYIDNFALLSLTIHWGVLFSVSSVERKIIITLYSQLHEEEEEHVSSFCWRLSSLEGNSAVACRLGTFDSIANHADLNILFAILSSLLFSFSLSLTKSLNHTLTQKK